MDKYIKWVDYQGDAIANKIEGGIEEGKTIYVARNIPPEGHGIFPGKFVVSTGNVGKCYGTGYGQEAEISPFQVATGDASKFKWVAQSGPFHLSNIPASQGIPVQGGYNPDRVKTPHYIARASVTFRGESKGVVCGYTYEGKPQGGALAAVNCTLEGTALTGFNGIYIARVSFGGFLHDYMNYEVLVYIGPPIEEPAPPVEEPVLPIQVEKPVPPIEKPAPPKEQPVPPKEQPAPPVPPPSIPSFPFIDVEGMLNRAKGFLDSTEASLSKQGGGSSH